MITYSRTSGFNVITTTSVYLYDLWGAKYYEPYKPVSTLKYFYDIHELHEMGLFISLIQTVDTQKFAFAVEFQFNTAV